MKPNRLILLIWIVFSSLIVFSAEATQYLPEDWVSYTDLRYITSIAVDLRFVYFGTRDGICVYDKLKERWGDPITTGDGLPTRNVDVVGIDVYTNNLLVSSGSNIYSYASTLEDWESYEMEGVGGSFTSIGVNAEYIWGEGPDLKIRFDKITRSWVPVDRFEDDIKWFGKRGEVDIKKPRYSFLAPFYIPGRHLERYDMTAAVEDGKILWVGTEGYGSFKYDLIDLTSTHLLMGVAGGGVDAMYLDEGTLWFGGKAVDASAVTRWCETDSSWVYYDKENDVGLFSNRISVIVADSKYVWLGTEHGLTRFDKKKGIFKTFTVFDGLPRNEVTAELVHGDSLWVGTSYGLAVMDVSSSDFTRMTQLKVRINHLAVSNESLWVATSEGVFILDIQSGKWLQFKDPEGLLEVSTNYLLFDGGKIWFGTWRGLISFDMRSKTWKRFTYPVHLPDEKLRVLAADEKNLWVGTGSGVAHLRKDIGDWIKYDKRDGLIGEEVNAIVIHGDYVFFGTDEGVTRFYWNDPFLVR